MKTWIIILFLLMPTWTAAADDLELCVYPTDPLGLSGVVYPEPAGTDCDTQNHAVHTHDGLVDVELLHLILVAEGIKRVNEAYDRLNAGEGSVDEVNEKMKRLSETLSKATEAVKAAKKKKGGKP